MPLNLMPAFLDPRLCAFGASLESSFGLLVREVRQFGHLLRDSVR